jgi:hypothetical protein
LSRSKPPPPSLEPQEQEEELPSFDQPDSNIAQSRSVRPYDYVMPQISIINPSAPTNSYFTQTNQAQQSQNFHDTFTHEMDSLRNSIGALPSETHVHDEMTNFYANLQNLYNQQ